MFFLIGALRAVIELIGLCLLGQGVLSLVAGAGRARNPIYRFLAILTAPPRQLVRQLAPTAVPDAFIPPLTFLLAFFLWIGLAYLRTFV